MDRFKTPLPLPPPAALRKAVGDELLDILQLLLVTGVHQALDSKVTLSYSATVQQCKLHGRNISPENGEYRFFPPSIFIKI